jgi:hypothetical protein
LKRIVIIAGMLAGLLPGIAAAQNANVVTTPAPIDGDRAVVATIVRHAVSTINLCALATDRSPSADIRQMCRKASADDARIAMSGMQLAQRVGATEIQLQPLPNTPAVLEVLGKYSGHEFDRQFLLKIVELGFSEERTVRYAIEVATDAAIKHYEIAVLRLLEDHLDLAEGALRRVSEAGMLPNALRLRPSTQGRVPGTST